MPEDATHAADLSPRSTPALISYINLAIFGLTAFGVFIIIFNHLEVTPVMAGVLGAVLGASGNALAQVNGFWMGSSQGAKKAQSDLADSAKAGQAALAQLAGSGPPPPAAPLDGTAPADDTKPTS